MVGGGVPDRLGLLANGPIEGRLDCGSVSIQVDSARRRCTPVGLNAESVAGETGDDVKMGVRHFLHRDLSVGEEQVETLGAEVACTESGGELLGDREHLASELDREFVQARSMLSRNDQEMSWCQRIEVHERNDVLVLIHEARRCLADNDPAEDAGRVSVSVQLVYGFRALERSGQTCHRHVLVADTVLNVAYVRETVRLVETDCWSVLRFRVHDHLGDAGVVSDLEDLLDEGTSDSVTAFVGSDHDSCELRLARPGRPQGGEPGDHEAVERDEDRGVLLRDEPSQRLGICEFRNGLVGSAGEAERSRPGLLPCVRDERAQSDGVRPMRGPDVEI